MPVSFRGPKPGQSIAAPPPTAPSVVGVSNTGGWANNGTATPDMPVGAAAGRLVLALGFARFAGQLLDTPVGYTRISGDDDFVGASITTEISAKISGASETAVIIHSNILASQPTGGLFIIVKDWRGALSDLTLSAPSVATNGANVVCPDALALRAGSLVLRIIFAGDDNAILTPMPNHTLVKYDATPLGSDGAFIIYSQVAAVPGQVGTATVVMGGSDPWNTYTLIIPPAGS